MRGKTKICSKCGVEKSFSDFHNLSTTSDGKRSECRSCRNAWRRKAREAPTPQVKKSKGLSLKVGDQVELQGLKGIVANHPGYQKTVILWETQTWTPLDKEIQKLIKKFG